MALTAAERLLQDLGVSEPGEIDLEAIAYHLNARVQYKPLDGCEARIVGAGDRAIITVNNRSGWSAGPMTTVRATRPRPSERQTAMPLICCSRTTCSSRWRGSRSGCTVWRRG